MTRLIRFPARVLCWFRGHDYPSVRWEWTTRDVCARCGKPTPDHRDEWRP